MGVNTNIMDNNLNEFKEHYNNFTETIKNQKEKNKLPIFKKRFRAYNPNQITFFTFDPLKTFPMGCFERFIVETIKNIDISDFEKREKCDLGGPDEINPKAILGIIFYGESDGVFSSRDLETLSQFDQRYMFIGGGETPDHSTIARFINKYENEIINVFIQILYIANNMGYVDYKKLVTDGSKFKAYASEKFTGTLEDFRKRKGKLEEKIILAIEKQKKADKEEERKYWKNKEDRHKNDLEKIDNFLKDAKEIYNKNKKESKQNITDNDCRIMKMNNSGFSEAYNAQITACEKNGIITSCDVTNQANDYEMVENMIERTEELAPLDKKEKVKEAKQLFDNGYYTIDNLKYCNKNNIDAYIPNGQDKHIFQDKEYNHSGKKKLTGRDCRIEKIDNKLKVSCPKGHELEFLKKYKNGDDYSNFYRIKNKKDCKTCEYNSICLKDCDTHKVFSIGSKLIDNFDIIKNMYEKLRSDEGKIIYSRRMPTIEKIFGHIKKNLGLQGFTVIGLEKIRAHWTIICTVYNLKRIFNLGIQSTVM